MQVKKFEAQTIADALKLVKAELGPEAIILSTKQNKKGFGLLSKASIEVTAAVTEKSLAKKIITERMVPESRKDQLEKMPAMVQSKIYNNFAGYVEKRFEERHQKKNPQKNPRTANVTNKKYVDMDENDNFTSGLADATIGNYARNGKANNQQQTAASSANAQSHNAQMQSDAAANAQMRKIVASKLAALDEMAISNPSSEMSFDNSHVEELQNDVKKLKEMVIELKSEHAASADTSATEQANPELYGEFQNLLRNGIEKKIAVQILKQVKFELDPADLRNEDKVFDAIAVEIMNSVKTDDVFEKILQNKARSGRQTHVLAFVGPTGVGKTTTIAKLASIAILNRNLKVGLINVDTYKVAALDQLATYAKILNAPFRQASNAIELDRAISEFKTMDLVLIDTTGRSQKDAESLAKMRALLSEIPTINTQLIMAATTRDQELQDIHCRFKIFNPAGITFSKLDECSTYGSIFNMAVKTKLPLTWFTTGQRVPEDIEMAAKERLAALIMDL